MREFADWHPRLSALIIAVLYTVVPGVFMLVADTLSGGRINTALIVVIYAFAVQLVLWLKIERPALIILPFGMILVGFVACEIIYTVAMSAVAPGETPSLLAMLFSSAIVTVFGAEAAGVIGALLCYGIIVIVRKVWQMITHSA